MNVAICRSHVYSQFIIIRKIISWMIFIILKWCFTIFNYVMCFSHHWTIHAQLYMHFLAFNSISIVPTLYMFVASTHPMLLIEMDPIWSSRCFFNGQQCSDNLLFLLQNNKNLKILPTFVTSSSTSINLSTSKSTASWSVIYILYFIMHMPCWVLFHHMHPHFLPFAYCCHSSSSTLYVHLVRSAKTKSSCNHHHIALQHYYHVLVMG